MLGCGFSLKSARNSRALRRRRHRPAIRLTRNNARTIDRRQKDRSRNTAPSHQPGQALGTPKVEPSGFQKTAVGRVDIPRYGSSAHRQVPYWHSDRQSRELRRGVILSLLITILIFSPIVSLLFSSPSLRRPNNPKWPANTDWCWIPKRKHDGRNYSGVRLLTTGRQS